MRASLPVKKRHRQFRIGFLGNVVFLECRLFCVRVLTYGLNCFPLKHCIILYMYSSIHLLFVLIDFKYIFLYFLLFML